jgi:hypothetical protein
MSIAHVEVSHAYLRSSKDSESVFFKRKNDWMDESKWESTVPGVVKDQVCVYVCIFVWVCVYVCMCVCSMVSESFCFLSGKVIG